VKVCDFCDCSDYVNECESCGQDACIDCRPGEGDRCAECCSAEDGEPGEGEVTVEMRDDGTGVARAGKGVDLRDVFKKGT
jgi:hypothetical protein